jgi:hypothetical protein
MVPIFSCILLHRYVHHVASIISKTAETCACVDFVDCVLHVRVPSVIMQSLVRVWHQRARYKRQQLFFLAKLTKAFVVVICTNPRLRLPVD